MNIRIVSNLGLRVVPMEEDSSIHDVMAAEQLQGFQVILPVCKDRELAHPLSEGASLKSQGLKDNSIIYCKFKLKEEVGTGRGQGGSDKSPAVLNGGSRCSKTDGCGKNSTISKPLVDALSPMHIRPTVITRKRSKVPSIDKILFSPPPPSRSDNNQNTITPSSIPKLFMRERVFDGFENTITNTSNRNNGKEEDFSPMKIRASMPMRKRSKSQEEVEDWLFSPGPYGTSNKEHGSKKRARLDLHPTPSSVCKLQDVLDLETAKSS